MWLDEHVPGCPPAGSRWQTPLVGPGDSMLSAMLSFCLSSLYPMNPDNPPPSPPSCPPAVRIHLSVQHVSTFTCSFLQQDHAVNMHSFRCLTSSSCLRVFICPSTITFQWKHKLIWTEINETEICFCLMLITSRWPEKHLLSDSPTHSNTFCSNILNH